MSWTQETNEKIADGELISCTVEVRYPWKGKREKEQCLRWASEGRQVSLSDIKDGKPLDHPRKSNRV
jgi:hypothetical protein